MELTVSTVLYIFAGLLALSISIFIYIYFNGGIQNNIQTLLGVIS